MKFYPGDKVTWKPGVRWLNDEHPAIQQLRKKKFLIVSLDTGYHFTDMDGYTWSVGDFTLYKRKKLRIKLP